MADGFEVSIENDDLIINGQVIVKVWNPLNTSDKLTEVAKAIAQLENLPEEIREEARQKYIEYIEKNSPDLMPQAKLELARYQQDPKWPDDINPIYDLSPLDFLDDGTKIRESLQKTLLTLGSIKDPVERREVFNALYATIEDRDYLSSKESVLDTAYIFGEYMAITGDTEMVQRWYEHGVQSDSNPDGVPPHAINMMIHAGIEAELAAGHTITSEHLHDLVEYYYRGADSKTIAEAYNAINFSTSHDDVSAKYAAIFNGNIDNPLEAYRNLEAEITNSDAFKNAVENAINSGVSADAAASIDSSEGEQYYDGGDVIVKIDSSEFNITKALNEEAAGKDDGGWFKDANGLDGMENFLGHGWNQFWANAFDRDWSDNTIKAKMENASVVVTGVDKVFADERKKLIADKGFTEPLSEEQNKEIIKDLQPLIHAYEKVFAAMDAEINGGVAMDIPAKDLLLIVGTAGSSFTPEQWDALSELANSSKDMPPEVKAMIGFVASEDANKEQTKELINTFTQSALAYAEAVEAAGSPNATQEDKDKAGEAYAAMTAAAAAVTTSDDFKNYINSDESGLDSEQKGEIANKAELLNLVANLDGPARDTMQEMVSAYLSSGEMPDLSQQQMLDLMQAVNKGGPQALDTIRSVFGDEIKVAIDKNDELLPAQKELLKDIFSADSNVSSEQLAKIIDALKTDPETGEIIFDNLTIGELLDVARAYTGYTDGENGDPQQGYVEIGKAEDGEPVYGRPVDGDIEGQIADKFGLPEGSDAELKIIDGKLQYVVTLPYVEGANYDSYAAIPGAVITPPTPPVAGQATQVEVQKQNDSYPYSNSSTEYETVTTGGSAAQNGNVIIPVDGTEIKIDEQDGKVVVYGGSIYFAPNDQDAASSSSGGKIGAIANVIAEQIVSQLGNDVSEEDKAKINAAVSLALPAMMSGDFAKDHPELLNATIDEITNNPGLMLQLAGEAARIDPAVAGPLSDMVVAKFMPEMAGKPEFNALISDFITNLDPADCEEIAKALAGKDIGPAEVIKLIDDYYLREPARALEELPKPDSVSEDFSEEDSKKIIQIATSHGFGTPDKDGNGKVSKDEYNAWYDYAKFKDLTEEEIKLRAEKVKAAIDAAAQGSSMGNLSGLWLDLAVMFLPILEAFGFVTPEQAEGIRAKAKYENVDEVVADIMADPSVQEGMEYVPEVDPATGKINMGLFEQFKELDSVEQIKSALTAVDVDILADNDKFALAVLATGDVELLKTLAINPPVPGADGKIDIEAYIAQMGDKLTPEQANALRGLDIENIDINAAIAGLDAMAPAPEAKVVEANSVGDDVEIGSKGNETSTESYSFSYTTTDSNADRAEINSLIAIGYVTHNLEVLAAQSGVEPDTLLQALFTGAPPLTEDQIKVLEGELGVKIEKNDNGVGYQLSYPDGGDIKIDLTTVHGWEDGHVDLFMSGMADKLNDYGFKVEVFAGYGYLEQQNTNPQIDLSLLVSDPSKISAMDQATRNIFLPSYMFTNEQGDFTPGEDISEETLSYLNPTPPAIGQERVQQQGFAVPQ